MRGVPSGALWKISTFTALGLAGFLALHPLGGSPTDAKNPAAQAKHSSGGIFGWFGGSSPSDPSAPHTGTHLVQLRDARNVREECDALGVLANEAAGDEEAIGEIGDRAGATHPRAVRVCAISALEKIRSAGARSYLGNLVDDPDTYVRDAALHSLAEKARDDADARAIVITAAHSDDEETRLEALIALGEAHIPEASALIQAALATETGDTRARLVSALGETRDTNAVGAISQMVNDGSSDARHAAIEALGSIGGDQAVKLLEDKLANGSREDANAAALALARTGDAGARQTLLDSATKGTYQQQIAAIRALGRVDGEDVHGAMLKALHSGDPSVVSATTAWFSSHGDHTAVADLVSVLKTAPADTRGALVSALGGIGGDDARTALADIARTPGEEQSAALNELAGMTGGRDEARKIALRVAKEGGQATYSALTILGQDGTRESRDALVGIAKIGGDAASQAMSALAQNGDPDATRALADLSRTAKTPELRSQALTALARTGDPNNAATFVAASREKDENVKRAAIAGLGRIGGPDAERALVDVTSSSSSFAMRAVALRSLSQIHSPTATAEIERLASDPDPNIQRTAYSTLTSLAPDRATAIADRAMSSGTAEERQMIVQNVSNLAPDVSRRILTTAIRDTDDSVASLAIDGLATLGGHDAQQALLDLLTSNASDSAKRNAADALDRSATDMAREHSGLIDRYKSPDEPTDTTEGDSDDGDMD